MRNHKRHVKGCQHDRTLSTVLTLHAINPGSISSIAYKTLPGVIYEFRSRSNFWVLLNMGPNNLKQTKKTCNFLNVLYPLCVSIQNCNFIPYALSIKKWLLFYIKLGFLRALDKLLFILLLRDTGLLSGHDRKSPCNPMQYG